MKSFELVGSGGSAYSVPVGAARYSKMIAMMLESGFSEGVGHRVTLSEFPDDIAKQVARFLRFCADKNVSFAPDPATVVHLLVAAHYLEIPRLIEACAYSIGESFDAFESFGDLPVVLVKMILAKLDAVQLRRAERMLSYERELLQKNESTGSLGVGQFMPFDVLSQGSKKVVRGRGGFRVSSLVDVESHFIDRLWRRVWSASVVKSGTFRKHANCIFSSPRPPVNYVARRTPWARKRIDSAPSSWMMPFAKLFSMLTNSSYDIWGAGLFSVSNGGNPYLPCSACALSASSETTNGRRAWGSKRNGLRNTSICRQESMNYHLYSAAILSAARLLNLIRRDGGRRRTALRHGVVGRDVNKGGSREEAEFRAFAALCESAGHYVSSFRLGTPDLPPRFISVLCKSLSNVHVVEAAGLTLSPMQGISLLRGLSATGIFMREYSGSHVSTDVMSRRRGPVKYVALDLSRCDLDEDCAKAIAIGACKINASGRRGSRVRSQPVLGQESGTPKTSTSAIVPRPPVSYGTASEPSVSRRPSARSRHLRVQSANWSNVVPSLQLPDRADRSVGRMRLPPIAGRRRLSYPEGPLSARGELERRRPVRRLHRHGSATSRFAAETRDRPLLIADALGMSSGALSQRGRALPQGIRRPPADTDAPADSRDSSRTSLASSGASAVDSRNGDEERTVSGDQQSTYISSDREERPDAFLVLRLADNSFNLSFALALGELFRASPQTDLTYLNLTGNVIGASGASAIADLLGRANARPSVEFLVLSGCKIGGSGVRLIANALRHNSSLRFLCLSGNVSPGDSASSTGSIGTHRHSGLPIVAVFRELGSAVAVSALEGLNLSHNAMGPAAVASFCESLLKASQTRSSRCPLAGLSLAATQCGSAGAVALSNLLQSQDGHVSLRPFLTDVSLASNQLSNEVLMESVAPAIVESSKQVSRTRGNLGVTAIDISGNSFDSDAGKTLGSLVQLCTSLRLLNVSGNRDMGCRAVFDLCRGLQTLRASSAFSTLDISGCGVRNTGAQYLARVLAVTETITHVYASDNPIADKGAFALADALHVVCDRHALHDRESDAGSFSGQSHGDSTAGGSEDEDQSVASPDGVRDDSPPADRNGAAAPVDEEMYVDLRRTRITEAGLRALSQVTKRADGMRRRYDKEGAGNRFALQLSV